MKVLAIDFGGMTIKYFLIKNGKQIAVKISNSKLVMDWQKLISDIARKFYYFHKKYGPIAGVAMAFNSPVISNSKVRWGQISGFWEYYDVKKEIAAKNIIEQDKITILNDAKAALYAETKVGAARGHKNAVMLTYGTAVGGAAIIEGKIVNGKYGLGAELSNVALGYDGQNLESIKLWCEFGSMTFLENEYKKLAKKHLSGKKIFALADQNDAVAKIATTKLIKGIAIHVFSCCYIYGPSVILIGGGLSKRKQIASEILAQVKIIENSKQLRFPVKVLNAQLGNKAGAFGAYYYWLDANHIKY